MAAQLMIFTRGMGDVGDGLAKVRKQSNSVVIIYFLTVRSGFKPAPQVKQKGFEN